MKTQTHPEATALLAQIEQLNVLVFAEAGNLLIRPAGKLPPEIRQRLIDLKAEVLKIAPRRRWRVTPPGREPFAVDCAGLPLTADEIRGVWIDAQVEPIS